MRGALTGCEHPGSLTQDEGVNLGGFDKVGGFTCEPQKYGAVCAMAFAGEGEGSEQFDPDACGLMSFRRQQGSKALGGPHGSDGVGTGRSYADLEEVEEAGRHPFILAANGT